MYDSRSNLGGSTGISGAFGFSKDIIRTFYDQFVLSSPLLEELRLLDVRRHGCGGDFVFGGVAELIGAGAPGSEWGEFAGRHAKPDNSLQDSSLTQPHY